MLNMISSKNMENRMSANYLIKIIFLTFLFISCVAVSQGVSGTYYVSPDGKSSWSECRVIEKPCSQATARSNAKDGDLVYFLPGTYKETIRFNNPGVTAKSYLKHEAVIDNNALTQGAYSSVNNTTFDGFMMRVYPTGADYTFAVYIRENAAGCRIINNKVVGMGTGSRTVGFHIRGNNSLVEGNEISNISHEGITYYTDTSLAGLCRYNYLHSWNDHTYGRGGADGLKVTGTGDHTGLILEYNEITGYLDDGIDLFRGKNVVVRYNYVHNPAVGHYGNGLKMGGEATTANHAYGNYIANLVNGTLNWGIITNGALPDSIFAYNVVVNAEVGIWAHKGSDRLKMYNNYVSARDRAVMISVGSQDIHLYNNIMDGGNNDLRINLDSSNIIQAGNNIHVNFPATHDSLDTKYDTQFDYFETNPGVRFTGKGVEIESFSSVIDTGTDLGGVFDIGFSQKTVFPTEGGIFPDEIVLTRQSECGLGWNIGPFINCPTLYAPYNIREKQR
jgi:hypothetical protein